MKDSELGNGGKIEKLIGKIGEIMSKTPTLVSTILYIFIYVILGIAFSSAIYDTTWLSPLDKPSVKVVYGLYLAWLGFFSFKISRGFVEHDIISALFPIETTAFITWGLTEHYNVVSRSEYFSTSPGAAVLLISLFIPYYYGNIHKSIFGGWKDKRNDKIY